MEYEIEELIYQWLLENFDNRHKIYLSKNKHKTWEITFFKYINEVTILPIVIMYKNETIIISKINYIGYKTQFQKFPISDPQSFEKVKNCINDFHEKEIIKRVYDSNI